MLFSKFTKSAFRSLTQSLCLCCQLLTVHLRLGMRIHVCSWLVPGVSSISLQQFLDPVSHWVDETDDLPLWSSVPLLLEKLLQRYSRQKDHQLWETGCNKCWTEMEDTPGTNQEHTWIRIPKRKWTVSAWLHRHRLWVRDLNADFVNFENSTFSILLEINQAGTKISTWNLVCLLKTT